MQQVLDKGLSYLASYLGSFLTILGILLLICLIPVRFIRYRVEAEFLAFTFTALVIAIFSGAQMFTIGIIGEYLARIHFRLMDSHPIGYKIKQRGMGDELQRNL